MLGVPGTASEKEICVADRKLARPYHSDLNQGSKNVEARGALPRNLTARRTERGLGYA
ncbi:MAG TPA: hypothetical protein VMW65_02465 [Chloroflexota bacterium]|nr:hypothetical protein [Chloroflexota bacterium]